MSTGDIFNIRDESQIERLVGTLNDPLATTGHVLAVQADKSIKAVPGGGGGGGAQVVTVPISSAQILDLANTPVTLIPGVAGFVTVVNGLALAYVAGLVPYLDGGGNITVATPEAGFPGSYVGPWGQLPSAGFWDQAIDEVAVQGCGEPTSTLTQTLIGTSVVAGQDVVLYQDAANPTLGNGTLQVSLSYFLAPTV